MKRLLTFAMGGSLLRLAMMSSVLLFAAATAQAAGADLGQAAKQATNWTAISMFAGFVVLTLFITKWAAAKTKSAADFYTAGGGITGFQNGLAIAGDYMSAASFLGISAAVMASGFDGLIYSIGFLVGWPEAMFAQAVKIKADLASNGGKTAGEAAKIGQSIMGPGNFVKDPISAISFGMALMFGTAGLPHILMRFFTVPSAKEARKSVMWATGWIGYFYLLTFIIGFGAITFVLTNPSFLDAKGGLIGGNNMAAVHLANAVGGNVFLGFISAVAFATILAVVAGLTLSGASAVSHDIYATVIKKGKADSASELKVSRMTTIALGVVAVLLGIAFEKQNIAFMVSLAFAIAASANFPVLFMSVLWKDCTTRGAVIGGFMGLISSVGLTIVSPSVWEATLGNPAGSALFPYTSPALFSMTIGFVGIWLFSVLDNSARAKVDRAGFLAQQVRSETGIGASGASGH